MSEDDWNDDDDGGNRDDFDDEDDDNGDNDDDDDDDGGQEYVTEVWDNNGATHQRHDLYANDSSDARRRRAVNSVTAAIGFPRDHEVYQKALGYMDRLYKSQKTQVRRKLRQLCATHNKGPVQLLICGKCRANHSFNRLTSLACASPRRLLLSALTGPSTPCRLSRPRRDSAWCYWRLRACLSRAA